MRRAGLMCTLDADNHVVEHASVEDYIQVMRSGGFDEADRRVVSQVEIGDVHVSTVFLMIDHGRDSPAPIVFETMTFRNTQDPEDRWHQTVQARYCCWTEASLGHTSPSSERCARTTSSRRTRCRRGRYRAMRAWRNGAGRFAEAVSR